MTNTAKTGEGWGMGMQQNGGTRGVATWAIGMMCHAARERGKGEEAGVGDGEDGGRGGDQGGGGDVDDV